jgi:hypothetical protein
MRAWRSSRRLAAAVAPRAVALALALVGGAPGCAPSCETLCNKLERCDLDPGVSSDECRETCDRQISFFKEDNAQVPDGDGLGDAFYQHRVCLGAHTCDEIAAGACYDEDLFLFDVSTPGNSAPP